MSPIWKLLMSLALLLVCVRLRAEEKSAYRATESGNNLEIVSPYGAKLYFGDLGFDALESYRFEIPIRELRSSTSAALGADGGSSGRGDAPENSGLKDLDDDQLVLEANRLYNSGKFPQALAIVEQLLRRNPSFARAWVMRGSLMHVQGQRDLAKKAWRKALDLDPGNQQVRSLLERYQ